MDHDGQPSQPQPDQPEALIAALVEIEHHVGASGWDQPARLFALVRTADLLAAEPHLADQVRLTSDDALSSIEQDDFRDGEDLLTTLRGISWTEAVTGCAIALERTFLPAGLEDQIPAHPDEATRFVAEHPQRQDVRVVVGALRDGSTHGLARLVSRPEDLLAGHDLVPGLSQALAGTLQ
ncbi:PPA1309 family protein [Luteococcus peritonei]|uniref:PPA1309 family protein n=1 Tax=Luteococcus peritonei TaxID=88874 RepID=A0ABW4RYT5_9ACTN